MEGQDSSSKDDKNLPKKQVPSSQSIKQTTKKKNFREKELPKEIVLNFKYEDFDPKNEKYYPQFRKRQHTINYENVNLLDQNRFHFILSNDAEIYNEYCSYSESDFANIKWKDIKIIIYNNVEEYFCPICLESTMECPMITNCGHVFCYPCLISYFKYYTEISVNKKIPKCPLCANKIDLNKFPAKFCEMKKLHNYTNNDEIYFNLIMRQNNSPTLYNLYSDPDLNYWKSLYRNEMKEVPLEKTKGFSFNRLFYSNKKLMKNRLEKYKTQLEKGLKEELEFYADPTRIECINYCIDKVNKLIEDNEKEVDYIPEYNQKTPLSLNNSSFVPKERKQSNISNDENNKRKLSNEDNNKRKLNNDEEEIDYSKYYFFYQENYGDIYFLHPYEMNILLHEYGNYENLPIYIGGPILDIEMSQITPFLKSKYHYLTHLRIGSIVFFVEIELGNLISQKTRKKFGNELKERAKYRRLLSNEEKHYEKFIKKKENKQNEETKMLISSYNKYKEFKENQIKEDEKKEEEKKDEEEKKNEEEKKDEENENKKENGEEEKETINKKENLLKLLLIDEEEERKIEEEKEKENEFKLIDEEFPELNNIQISHKAIKNKNKGGKKNKKKFKDVNDIILTEITIGRNSDDSSDGKKKNKKKNKNNGKV